MNRRPTQTFSASAVPACSSSRFRLALSFLGLALALRADPASDAYRQAHSCLVSNRFAEAAALFQAAAATTNSAAAAAAWLGRGEALFGASQWEAAIDAYNRLLAAYPDSPLAPNALCARGFAEAKASRLPQALATFQSFTARFPGHALAASAAASTGALSRTLASLERQKAEEALGRDTAAINACLRDKNPGGAAAAAERFLQAHPDAATLADVRLLAAECAFRAGDFSGARRAYRRFLEHHPQHAQAPGAWLELGKTLCALSLFGEAAEAFANAKGLPQAVALRADSLFQAGRHEEALRLYESLAQTSTNKLERARIALAMGDCFAALQNWPEAERLFLSVELLHASEALRPIALGRLAELYARTGQTNQAERSRAELRRRYPDFK